MRANMYKFLVALGLATSFLFAASGCKEPQAQARQPNKIEHPSLLVCTDSPKVQERQVVMILIDCSGSVRRDHQDQLAETREDASGLVRRLPPATRVFVRFISENSYVPDTERSLRGVIPDEPPPLLCPPFDRHCHEAERKRKAQLPCVDEARERLATAVQNLNPARANKTDVWGAIAAASDVLSAYPQSQRFIVIYSDLVDTVGAQLPDQLPGLANAKVIARMVKNGDPLEPAQRLSAFSKRLAKWGATVESITPEVPIDGDIFVQPPAAGNTLTASK